MDSLFGLFCGGGVAAELGWGDAGDGAACCQAAEGAGGDGVQGGAGVGLDFVAGGELGQGLGGAGAVGADAAAHVAAVDHRAEVGVGGQFAAVLDGEVRHASACVQLRGKRGGREG